MESHRNGYFVFVFILFSSVFKYAWFLLLLQKSTSWRVAFNPQYDYNISSNVKNDVHRHSTSGSLGINCFLKGCIFLVTGEYFPPLIWFSSAISTLISYFLVSFTRVKWCTVKLKNWKQKRTKNLSQNYAFLLPNIWLRYP